MAQPPEVEFLASRLTEVYRSAQRQIDEQLAALGDDPKAFRSRSRLSGLRRNVDALMEHVDAQARTWIENDLPRIYTLGSGGTWEQADIDAVIELGIDLFDDLLTASNGVRADVRALIRQGIEEATRGSVAAGKTAVQAARDAARSLAEQGIKAVTYRDGSRVSIGTYSEMAIRTKSAVAYNAGTLGANGDVQFFEVFDGIGCGWGSHNDPDTAHGSIRSRAEAQAFPISHPRCRRSFSPRPDLNQAATAAEGFGTTTPEQDRAQAIADEQRTKTQIRRAARRSRSAVRAARNS